MSSKVASWRSTRFIGVSIGKSPNEIVYVPLPCLKCLIAGGYFVHVHPIYKCEELRAMATGTTHNWSPTKTIVTGVICTNWCNELRHHLVHHLQWLKHHVPMVYHHFPMGFPLVFLSNHHEIIIAGTSSWRTSCWRGFAGATFSSLVDSSYSSTRDLSRWIGWLNQSEIWQYPTTFIVENNMHLC